MEGLMRITGKSRNTIRSRLDSMPTGHIAEFGGGGNKKIYKLNLAIT